MVTNKDLAKIQDFDLNGKVILIRMDHNVVEHGLIKDAFRLDSTFGLIYYIASKGGFPILMTHIGRTRDKKTGHIQTGAETSVAPVVAYLNRKLEAGFKELVLPAHLQLGIANIDETIMAPAMADLKARKIGGIYLPNTRWFAGEESKDDKTSDFASELSSWADLYVNEAFGSWQAHASTFDV
ncbi:MAG: phosphoglycerate kinase, partial [Candidatus Adiutrix sp.]